MRARWLICMPYLAGGPQPCPPLHRLSAFSGRQDTAQDSGIYNQPLSPCPFSLFVTSRLGRNEKQWLLLTNKARTLTAITESSVKACPICRFSQTMTQNSRRQAPNPRQLWFTRAYFRAGTLGMGGIPLTTSLPKTNPPLTTTLKKKKKKERRKEGRKKANLS